MLDLMNNFDLCHRFYLFNIIVIFIIYCFDYLNNDKVDYDITKW